MASSSQQAKRQKIQYHHITTKGHKFLNFEKAKDQNGNRINKGIVGEWDTNLDNLRNKQIFPGKKMNWQVCDQIKITDRLREYLVYRPQLMGMEDWEDLVWFNLCNLDAPIFEELCLEFFSTYTFDEENVDWDDDDTIKFRLGGKSHSLSLKQLARYLNLYPQSIIDHPDFNRYMVQGHKWIRTDLVENVAWEQIGDGNWISGKSTVRSIRDPIHRVIHRIVKSVLTTTSTSWEKVNSSELWFLHNIINHEPINVPFCLAEQFTRFTGDRGDGYICGGYFVSILARSLELLPQEVIQGLTKVQESWEEIGYDSFKGMRVIRKIPGSDTFVLWTQQGAVQPQQQQQEQQAHPGIEDPLVTLTRRMDEMSLIQQQILTNQQRMFEEMQMAHHTQTSMLHWQQDNSMGYYRQHNFDYHLPPEQMWDVHGHYRQQPGWSGSLPDYRPRFGTYDPQQHPYSSTQRHEETDDDPQT